MPTTNKIDTAAVDTAAAAATAMLRERGWTDDRVLTLANNVESSTYGAYAVGATYVAAGLNHIAAREALRDLGIRRGTVDAFVGSNAGAYRQRGYLLDTLRHCGIDLATYDAVHDDALIRRASEVAVSTVIDARDYVSHVASRLLTAEEHERAPLPDSAAACWQALIDYRDGDDDARDAMWTSMRTARAETAGKAAEAARAALAAVPADAPDAVRKAAEAAVATAEASASKAAEAVAAPRPAGKSTKRNGKAADGARSVEFTPAEWTAVNAAHDAYNSTVTRGKKPNLTAFIVRAAEALAAAAAK